MMNKRAFTLVEMLVSMVVAAILMVIVGKLSDIAMSSSRRLRKESEMFSEIMYAFKKIQKYVREEPDICDKVSPPGSTGSNSWNGNILECPPNQPTQSGVAFGVWTGTANRRQLVYLKNKNSTATREVLFEIPTTGTNSLTMTATLSVSGTMGVGIQGEKDKIKFKLKSTITGR